MYLKFMARFWNTLHQVFKTLHLTLILSINIGGNIDSAHHGGHAKKALHEAVAFNDAVLKMDSMTNDKDTLSVVTADHSQPMIIAGYPGRGKDILGIFHHTVYLISIEW